MKRFYHRSLKLLSVMLAMMVTAAGTGTGEPVQRIAVEQIAFDGISAFDENRLLSVMVTRPSGKFRKNYYNDEILNEDLRSLELFYHQNGYLDAKITSHHVAIDSIASRARINISITEGECTYFEGISLLGNEVFSDNLLLERISFSPGEAFSQRKINDSTLSLLTFYANNGYLDAEVRPDIRFTEESYRALVDYTINEHSQSTIGEITIQGLEKTNEEVILRELLFRPGEVVNYSKLIESQQNIYLTGLFESVYIRPQVSAVADSTSRNILITVSENLAGEFNVAVGYGSVDRTRSKIELFNNNLAGTSRKLGMVGRISFIQRGIETSFSSPWTLGRPVNMDITTLMENRFEPGYDLARIGTRVAFGRRFTVNKVVIAYRLERVSLSNIKVDVIPDAVKSNTNSIKLSFIHDTRDNLFNATRGNYFEMGNEVGMFYGNGKTGFYRFTGMAKLFKQVSLETVVGTAFELGLMLIDGGFERIPLHERFYTGGPNSLRGFPYEKVGPLNEKNVPTGGSLKFVWNVVEVRRRIYRMFGMAVFFDVGNVWPDTNTIRFADIRMSPGTGLQINTPIGLIRLDYGFNIDKRKGESPGQISFNMGQAF